MRLTADAAPAQQVRRLALGISHFLAPVTLATLLLLWAMGAGAGFSAKSWPSCSACSRCP